MFVIARLMPRWPEGVSVAGQFDHLLAHPFSLPAAMAYTASARGMEVLRSAVGIMGWVDTPMPPWYFWAAAIVLAFAVVAPGNRGAWPRPALLAMVTIIAFVMALCGALYVSWTPVAAQRIEGLQGRYFLPILPLLAWAVPEDGRRLERLQELAWYPVLLFPLVTLAVLPGVIVERYYGSWSMLAETLPALLLP
jgi:uncharacterized membrane protein